MNIIKKIARKRFVLRQLSQRKTMVFMLCTMRSGSTLLKSLLATAPDISHLPEVDFQAHQNWRRYKLKALSERPIIVLKKPAPLDDSDYPRIPHFRNSKTIILLRDAYPTVHSLRRMIEKAYPELLDHWTYDRLLHHYWFPVTQRLADFETEEQFLLRYEDLLKTPIPTTAALFRFLGSQKQVGTDTYTPPSTYQWQWGNDDGGQKIKTHRVQHSPVVQDDEVLLQLIQNSAAVQSLRQQIGYR